MEDEGRGKALVKEGGSVLKRPRDEDSKETLAENPKPASASASGAKAEVNAKGPCVADASSNAAGTKIWYGNPDPNWIPPIPEIEEEEEIDEYYCLYRWEGDQLVLAGYAPETPPYEPEEQDPEEDDPYPFCAGIPSGNTPLIMKLRSMDICSQINLSATDKNNDHHGLCMNTFESIHGGLKALSVAELNVHEYSTCSTFPSSGKALFLQDGITSEISAHGDNIKANDLSGFRSISLPAAVRNVESTVKWAPEVYDPIPTSVSHVVTNNRSSSKHSKKNSKNKKKHGSKSSCGSKSKDRKQVRKHGGNSSAGIGYKLEHEEQLVDFLELEPKSGGIDFHVGNHDQYCGSSFMKKYGTNVRLSSVAEAT